VVSGSRSRANGEGSIYPYKNGYAAYVWVRTPAGQRMRKYVYGKTREETHGKWVELAARAAKLPVPTSVPSVAVYLAYWLAEVIRPNREDATYAHYEVMSRLHVVPGVGSRKIDRLTVRETQAWLNKLAGACQCCAQKKDASRKEPRCCAAGDCCHDYPSRRVIEAARGTLRAALNHAMREELISRNVAELVTLPKARKKLRRRDSWTADEARKFLESSRLEGDPLYPLWVLIVVLGLRKGEALGLTWPDGDGDWPAAADDLAEISLEWQLQRVTGKPLTHKHQLKADGSTDVLPLPPIGVTALRLARLIQAKARDDGWPKSCICGESHELVFTTKNGHPIEPRNVNRAFDIRCARAGVRRITIHDTRRTCGSLLAALDVHPSVAMKILRHTRSDITMEIYTQVPDNVTRAALRRLSDELGQGDGTR
jgi:integrase